MRDSVFQFNKHDELLFSLSQLSEINDKMAEIPLTSDSYMIHTLQRHREILNVIFMLIFFSECTGLILIYDISGLQTRVQQNPSQSHDPNRAWRIVAWFRHFDEQRFKSTWYVLEREHTFAWVCIISVWVDLSYFGISQWIMLWISNFFRLFVLTADHMAL